MHLTIPVHGPNGDALAHVVGSRGTGPWAFTTFELILKKTTKRWPTEPHTVDDFSSRPTLTSNVVFPVGP